MGVLQGKKTYIAAALLVVLGVAGFLTQMSDEVTSAGLIVAGLGLVGLGAKAERHQKEIVDGLNLIRAAIEKRPLTTAEKAEIAADAVSLGTEALASAGTPMLGAAGAVLGAGTSTKGAGQ